MKYQNNFWNRYFKYYDVLLKVIPYQELFTRIAASLNLKPTHKVLDLGAGTGNLQLFLPKNTEVISLDNSSEALERLQTKFPDARVVKHSIQEKLPFPDNTFDRVVSNNVLYTLHAKEWDFILSEIKRVSKPESIIVISNLNKDFNAINVYKDHIHKSLKKKGLFKTIWQLTTLLYPTIKMIQFNKTINNNDAVGRYSFLTSDEQQLKFEHFGMISQQETEKVYADQAFLNVFRNEKETVENRVEKELPEEQNHGIL